jgi:hypothetical protein
MNCKEAIEHLLDFLEGSCCPETRTDIEKHVATCKICPDLVQSYQKTSSLCAKALRRDIPVDVVDRMLASLKEQTAIKKTK